jgi:hypothetical protein
VNVGGPTNVLDTRCFYVGGCRGESVIAFAEDGTIWKTSDGGDGTMGVKAELTFTHPTFQQISSCANEERTFKMVNLHCYSFLITSIAFDINPSGVFSMTAPAVPDTLKSDDTLQFKILFNPALKPGPFTAKVHVKGYFLNGLPPVSVDSIFDVSATALAEGPQLVVNPDMIAFDTTSICGGKEDTLFTLKNIGCDTLTITSQSQLTGDITIDQLNLPLRLPPDSVIIVHAHFKPTVAGNATIQFPVYKSTQQGSNASVQLSLSGFAEDGRAILVTSPPSIAFDTVSICGSGDSAQFTIKNTGCVALMLDGLTLSGDNDFSSGGIQVPTIVPQDSIKIWVRFSPKSKGSKNGIITIRSHSGSVDSTAMSSQIVLKSDVTSGSGLAIASLSSIDFGTMTSCQSRDSFITITNVGCDSIHLASGKLSGAGFSEGATSIPLWIPPKGKITIPIHAAPDNSGATNYSGTFTYTSDSAGVVKNYPPITFTFTLKNNPLKANLWLTIDNTSGTAGAKTTVRLKADPSVISQFGSVDVTLNVNQDLLELSGARGVNSNNRTSAASTAGPVSYRIAGQPLLKADADSSVALFDFVVFLTKDSSTGIGLAVDKIDNVVPGSGPCAVQASSAGTSFDYSKLCGDMPIQQYMRGDEIRIDGIEPNPTSGDVDVDIHCTGSSDATISVVSLSGVTISEKAFHLEPSVNKAHLPTSTLANGTYMIVLRSNGQSINRTITVQK